MSFGAMGSAPGFRLSEGLRLLNIVSQRPNRYNLLGFSLFMDVVNFWSVPIMGFAFGAHSRCLNALFEPLMPASTPIPI